MTEPARHAPPPPTDGDAALQRIRDHGGRVTAGKRALVHLLYDEDASLTIDEIAVRMSDHDRSAIYRMLAQLEGLGIAEHLHLGHGQAVHRAAGRGTVPIVCGSCGATVDLDRAQTRSFVRRVAERTGVTLDLAHFPLTGTCQQCARRDDAR
ncbi:MAG: transcriptional repressor [Ilumatobacteraceae bacterium]